MRKITKSCTYTANGSSVCMIYIFRNISSYANIWSKRYINDNKLSFFYNTLNATAPTLMHYFCVICTFDIDFLPKSKRHRIDDETLWTTATFYVLNFFVVVRKKNIHYNWHIWKVVNKMLSETGIWSKNRVCIFNMTPEWSLTNHYISISGLLHMIPVQSVLLIIF